ncbi:MAG: GntR family transcriptional regulator [Corynebacterium sp.]|uniref:GntR family transcriptional regulator n=1 Tax=Corynebacterium sp. TaxID=1720 RepID=UPI0026DFC51E|nr:GntR family transcriptional regulator [Corynebacterium sp.]MDO5670756.1 GntR family transcriptional regulator [Corynebacterium sp.]
MTAPLFRQIAALVEDLIVEDRLHPGDRAPSMNELADFHEINPATARRGLALLAGAGVLEKKRGLGMFVTADARRIILDRRRKTFAEDYLAPLIDEAAKLDFTRDDIRELIDAVAVSRGLYR